MEHGINYQSIIESESFGAMTKACAQKIQKHTYLSVGDYFKSLTIDELQCLLIMNELALTQTKAFDDVIAIVEMLANAEGCPTRKNEEVRSNFLFFISLCEVVSMDRKGLVEVLYENLTFGIDNLTAPIVKMAEDL